MNDETEGKELVNWEEKLAAEAKDVAATERPSVGTISFRSGVLAYGELIYPNNELDCVVVNQTFENRWYPGDWDPDNIVPPDCFAIDKDKEALAPHENSERPQAKTCADCELAKWGSDPRPGNRGKACGEIRRLAVIPYDAKNTTVEMITQAEVALMKIPVTSVRNWSNYVNKVGAAHRRPPWAVITKVKVVPDQKTQFKVIFDCPGTLPDDVLSALDAKRQSVIPVLMTPYDKPAAEGEPTEDKPDSTKY